MATRRTTSRVSSNILLLGAALACAFLGSLRPSFAAPAAVPRGATSAAPRAALLRAAARAGARSGCRGSRACMRAVGLLFSTQSGNTEEVAGVIGEKVGVEAVEIGEVGSEGLAEYDGLIVGAPTWNTDADEMRSGTSWDDYLDEIRELDLSGKPVAVFGCGDSMGYGDNFCDAIEEIHGAFQKAGAKMMGYVDASAYEHQESKSEVDGKFLGLPLDQDNEAEMTEDRVSAWISQLKSEGMPL